MSSHMTMVTPEEQEFLKRLRDGYTPTEWMDSGGKPMWPQWYSLVTLNEVCIWRQDNDKSIVKFDKHGRQAMTSKSPVAIVTGVLATGAKHRSESIAVLAMARMLSDQTVAWAGYQAYVHPVMATETTWVWESYRGRLPRDGPLISRAMPCEAAARIDLAKVTLMGQ